MNENTIEILNTDVIIECSDENDIAIDVGNTMIFDYNYLYDKPSINSVQLAGNKTSCDLGLASVEDMSAKEDVANKIGVLDASVNNTQYPTAKCVREGLLSKADTALSNLSAQGQAIIDSKADVNLSNLSAAAAEHLNSLACYENTGELLTDAEGLANLKNYAHSAFDRTKFTISGNPLITDDGVASGFSSSDKISATILQAYDIVNFTYTTTCRFIYDSSIPTGAVIYRVGRFLVDLDIGNSKLRLQGHDTNSTMVNFARIALPELNSGDVLDIKTSFNSTQQSISVSINGNTPISASASGAPRTEVISDIPVYIGVDVSTNPLTHGEVDLKFLSVCIDGISVFSGNQTGIDEIKTDDYTITGTPALTADGVASGFTTSNYISKTITGTLSKDTPFEFDFSFKTPEAFGGQQTIWGIDNNTRAYIGNTGTLYVLYLGVSKGVLLAAGTEYDMKLVYDGAQFVLRYKRSTDVAYMALEPTSVASANVLTNPNFGIGILASSLNNPFYGTIDLNKIRLYINGNLIWQPCMKIPYTQSKTGSKIVEAAYRTRVNDMYNQLGYAPYYTLSDNDFTLQQGEIYGIIAKTDEKTKQNKSDLQTKADKNLGNVLSSITSIPPNALTNIDGQWIDSHYVIADWVSASASDRTYSLSTYLPNDGYSYEVMFSAICETDSASGSKAGVAIITDVITSSNCLICRCQTRAAASIRSAGTVVVPVGTSRIVTVIGGTTLTGTFILYANAYRRIGTNV
ncbi:MAG: hypothetical protein K6A44_07795 [bacterium]|nr:hypothetical protein [bacterium]